MSISGASTVVVPGSSQYQPLINPITNTPLLANASFTSLFEFVEMDDLTAWHTYVAVIASSDQPGTLYIEQSIDGVNVSRSDSQATGADPGPQGGQSTLLKVQIIMPFVRYRYVNGATNQTRFVIWRRFVHA